MAEQPEAMTDDELRSILRLEVDDAVSFVDEEVSPDRARATRYFMGEEPGMPEGAAAQNRATFVSTDVRDSILAIMPELMRIFFGAERPVEYRPVGQEDSEAADQASDYVQYVVLGQDNDAFSIFYDWFMDALRHRLGVVKFWWDEQVELTETTLEGLTELQLAEIGQDGEEVIGYEEIPSEAGALYNVRIRRVDNRGKVKVEPIPPEEFFWSRTAKSIADARVCGHRTVMTVSDLVAMGYEWADVSDLDSDADLPFNDERLARDREGQIEYDMDSRDPSLRRVLYTEVYMRVDYDGDGYAEMRRICLGGTEYRILNNEPFDYLPFACLTPIPEPHAVLGTSISDLTMDIQRVKSQIIRDQLDSLSNSIYPDTVVVEQQVNYDDVLSGDLPRVIRVKTPGAYQEMPRTFTGAAAFPMIEYHDRVKQSRVGISEATQGLDADILKAGVTAEAVAAASAGGMARIEMIARVFAGTGVKDLFRGILRLLIRHQDWQRTVRLRNTWVDVSPAYWNAGMDVVPSVALGRGTNQERFIALQAIEMAQKEVIQTMGPVNPLVTLAQLRHTRAKMVELSGFRDPDAFWLDPDNLPEEIQQQMEAQQQPEEPAPDPNAALAEAEIQKAQIKAEVDREKMAADQQSAMLKAQLEQEKLMSAQQKIMLEAQLERERMQQQMAQFIAEMQATAQSEEAKRSLELVKIQLQESLRAEGRMMAARLRPVGAFDGR